jgi:hypothetical protein
MNHADISSAARLLRHALSPKDRPTPASQYRELLDRYQTDVNFAEIVERIAEGLGRFVRRFVASVVATITLSMPMACGQQVTKPGGARSISNSNAQSTSIKSEPVSLIAGPLFGNG